MKFINFKFVFLIVMLASATFSSRAQTITYSEVEPSDNRNSNFEILGRFNDKFLIYKNYNKRHDLTLYNSDMTVNAIKRLDYVSDRTDNIDFISYPDHFLMIWRYQRGSTLYCKAANLDAEGNMIGAMIELDTSRAGFLETAPEYDISWSEDKQRILLYKTLSKNDTYFITAKIFDERLKLLDSVRNIIDRPNRREVFGDLQIDNSGVIVYVRERQNARAEYINSADIIFRKMHDPIFYSTPLQLDNLLVNDVRVKIDNLNKKYLVNTFYYRKVSGNIDGLYSALITQDSFRVEKKMFNVFDDSLRTKLSGSPEWRTAYDNFYLRNVVLRKDGGFVIAAEEYTRKRRFGNSYDDRFGPYGSAASPYNRYYYSSPSDYYYYNRGYYGYYRPFGNADRDIIYNYDDVITLNFDKDLRLQRTNVINKTTSAVDTDNFLSFSNMNAGGEIHFLFLQKDNNKQVISDHALQADGSIVRYATLKSRESGFSFMPRLARQTGARQMIVPCIVRNNIAFAKIDF